MADGGDPTFILRDISELPRERDGIDGIERTVDAPGSSTLPSEREMESMVIRRAEPREDRAAAEKLSREICVAEKSGEVESLPFGIEVGIGGEHWNEKMAPIGGENNGFGFWADRAGFRFELPVKKFVEGAERAGSVEKFTRVHAESFDEMGYFFDR